VKWYYQAAQQGRPEAEYKVGYLYAQGLGVPQSSAEAIKWYRKADAHGYAYAHNALREMEK
jgi:TPR repeat protein